MKIFSQTCEELHTSQLRLEALIILRMRPMLSVAIASGLAGSLGELSSIKALHEKLEERRLAIVKILEALQRMP